MTTQRVNIDIDRELWKTTGIMAACHGKTKRDFVEDALKDKLGIATNNNLVFRSEEHKVLFEKYTPDKLRDDREWASVVYIFTSDSELQQKTLQHLYPDNHEIDWEAISDTDFGSGHYAAIHWAFALWSGNSWENVDTLDKAYYMDNKLKTTCIIALAYRWRLSIF
jgi:Arc/MetJ family transcription regulator